MNVTNSNLMCDLAGVQSGTAKPETSTEKLPPTITPSGSSASDLQDSGVVTCFFFVEDSLF